MWVVDVPFTRVKNERPTPFGFRPASEAEVVLAFLRAEAESPRFGADVRRALAEVGGMRLVSEPDLGAAAENRAREEALSRSRGWPDAEVFEDFPRVSVEWHHGPLPPEALARVRFIDYSYWNELSGGSRRPADVRATIEAGALPEWLVELGTDWPFELADRLADAEVVDDLIVVATPDLTELVVLEGHARLAAIFVGGHERRLTVNAYLGVSPEIERWDCF
jgi:hypothetical protein